MAGPFFGRQVRERRRALDLTQEELARRVGCAGITIRKLEAGVLRPSQQVAERLALALAVPPDERAAFVRAGRQVVPEQRPVSSPHDAQAMPVQALRATELSGQMIRGYQLQEQLGAGGFGAVYRAIQPLVEREVAVKIILPQYADHPDFVRRFEAEARLVARLEHPHIVPLYDYWREPGVAYLVMRFLRGGTLGALLQRGPPAPRDTLRLVEQIGAALHSAHRAGVVHRDLKPANILLDDEGNAYVADFGIAKDLSAVPGEHSFPHAFIGSPAYTSPEQIRAEPVTAQTDIYALGLLLYELLTGRRPFVGPTAGAFIQQHLSLAVPPLNEGAGSLNRIVQRATAKVPSARYADVHELVAELRGALTGGEGESVARRPRALVPAPPTVVLDLEAGDTPFKGLRPFDEADAADFFGREALIQQLLARLGEGGELARFLALIGPSGSGKSSAVRAGLIPALRAGALPGSEQWYVVDLVPGPRPLDALAAALRRVAPAGVEHEDLLALLRADGNGLLRGARIVLPADEGELVVVIDQFEELFTLTAAAAERERLLESIVAAVLDERSRVRVVVTLRADLIDRPLQYVDFGELLQQRGELVLPLTPDELERAIAVPARRAGLTLEAGLAASIVADASGQPGALPLLQHALSELYAVREGRALTRAAYSAIGGVTGAIARSAEQAYSALGPERQAVARQLFLRLITPGEGVEDTRRRVVRAELVATGAPETVDAVVDAFARARLLTLDRNPATREPTVEVAHEALLRAWPRLRAWVDAAREELRVQRRLARAAEEWAVSDDAPGFLATGGRLGQFAALGESGAIQLSAEERAYLDASLAARAAQERAEQERAERELGQIRALAVQERRRAEEEAATGRRLRAGAAVLALVSLFALGAALFAGQQQRRAQAASALAGSQAATAEAAQQESEAERDRAAREARLAQARALSAVAISNLEVDPERSLLLALQAVDTTYSVDAAVADEAAQALQRAVQTSRVRHTLRAHQGIVYGMALSADGARIASGGEDDQLVVWARASGEEQLRLNLYDDVHALAFSPDGSLLVSMAGPTVNRHDAATGAITAQFRRANELLINARLSPDGARLAITSSSGVIYLLDPASWEPLLELDGHPAEVAGSAFAADGARLVSGSIDGTLASWDLNSGQARFTRQTGGHIWAVAVAPGGAVATAGEDAVVRLWDGETGAPLRTLVGHSSAVHSVAFDPEGTRLVSASSDGTAKLWDVASGRLLLTLNGHGQAVLSAEFTPDGAQVVTASADGTVRIWDAPAGHVGRIAALAYSADGRYLVTAGGDDDDRTARVWVGASGEALQSLRGHTARLTGAAISADGTTAATAAADGSVRLWDVTSGRERLSFVEHTAEILALALSSDGSLVASGGRDQDVLLWDAASGRVLRHITIAARAAALEFSPDGRALAIASHDAVGVRVVPVERGAPGRELRGHTNWVWDVAYSPDGAYLASASEDQTVAIWSTRSWQRERSLTSPDGALTAVAYSPNGALLAAATRRGTVIIWEAATGRQLHSFPQPQPIHALVFQPDGARLLAATEHQPLAFMLAPGELIATARELVTRPLTDQECRQYLGGAACPPDG